MNNPNSTTAIDVSKRESVDRTAHGLDFVEVKEAIVDGLLRLTEQRCSGASPEGALVYGVRPSSKFVTGFLLPRFDRSGQEDETSDIHIATIGLDLQLLAGASGLITVAPQFSIYLRELPNWDELSDPRHDMQPLVQLSRQSRTLVDQRARDYISHRLAELPPIDEPEDADQAGGDIVRAELEREVADAAKDSPSSPDGDADLRRGNAKAAAESMERAEALAERRKQNAKQRSVRRAARRAEIAGIRREAYDRAFQELGIHIREAKGGAPRNLTADDIADEERSSLTKEEALNDQPNDGLEPSPDTEHLGGSSGEVRKGVLDDAHAAPQPIPYKWRRVPLQLGAFTFDPSINHSRVQAQADFAAKVGAEVDRVTDTWLASSEGQRDAYRRDVRILPSQFASRSNWEQYLNGLRAQRPAVRADVRPTLDGLAITLDLAHDFADPERVNLRVAIENGAAEASASDATAFEHAIFQVGLSVLVPRTLHRPLKLDRIEPSYRFRQWLDYPAMGLNCGVREKPTDGEALCLEAVWAPRYTQPRVDARDVSGVPTSYAILADPATDVTALLKLTTAYEEWIEERRQIEVGAGLPERVAAEERRSHARTIAQYEREQKYIADGVNLLAAAQDAARRAVGIGRGSQEWKKLQREAAPWYAWLRMNEAFRDYGQDRFTDWRLFQLAFVLAHIPTFASRMEEYQSRFDEFRDEMAASLLYFATGGGKSEAFFGLLIFALFLDRLRGKGRGVTALIRYPLRLLTLQQARRLMRILVQAELVRLRYKIPGFPFELGFWVGSGNTPNRAAQGFGGVPSVSHASYPDDVALLNPPDGHSESAAAARRRSQRYIEVLEAYDKLRTCPCCGSATGMRKYPEQHGRIGIVCFNPECSWNLANPPSPVREPLPFLLTDDTIYQRAPSIILGTVDKLALIGQHDRTINAIAGMFGCARYMCPDSQHLFVPRGQKGLAAAIDKGWLPLKPAFANGADIFVDPFPSLIIQDEGHLLDESLGTFAGLFETTLEEVFRRLGHTVLKGRVALWPSESNEGPPKLRLSKIVAATATISDPERQLRVLYQRQTLRFPCPGLDLYESFYAAPREPLVPERQAFALTLPDRTRAEYSAPRMRTYVSMMTNGRSHTMTTSAIVSAYHLLLTECWQLLVEQGRVSDFVTWLSAALSPDDPLTPLRAARMKAVGAAPDGLNVLASLLDLMRVSLTYVTNKKGGDQIIETLQSQVDRDQREAGIGEQDFRTDLISGGITVAEIQDVMQRAEGTSVPGQPFKPLAESLRNIVATSAISHGVDVDKFNAMFFAGLPTDVSEYIQASSRVGRTHVGFSLLIPTPHARRDRYVVETHDQFHRFLERMIAPPAVQRWALSAIGRMIPSAFQTYLCAVVEQEEFARAADGGKANARHFTTQASVKAWADSFRNPSFAAAVRAVTEFVLNGIGIEGRGETGIGRPTHAEHYSRFVEDRVRKLLERFTAHSDPARLSLFWQASQSAFVKKPMTSLRDIDSGGVILSSSWDPYRRKRVHPETVRQVMKQIRGQRTSSRTEIDADPPMIDTEDRP